MTRILFVAIATMTAFVPLAHAEDTNIATTFTTVDSFARHYAAKLTITGIQAGQSAPNTITYTNGDQSAFDGCERNAMMMMNRPGRFTLQVSSQNVCTLNRLP
jgi:hypothetical protein